MTEHSIHHGAFTIERVYDASPARVFDAWADNDARMRWGAPEGHAIDFVETDFRVGGRDLCRCGPSGNLIYLVETRYDDIVPGQRVVFGETVSQGSARLAASLITVELTAEGAGTRLTLTDQIASFVGAGMVSGSKGGYGGALDNLAGELKRDAASAGRAPAGSARSAKHATFTVERRLAAPPARVFQAYADPKAKANWFGGPSEWEKGPRQFDFRVGGRETNSGGPEGGPVHSFDCLYQDIVPDERIVYTYGMHLDDALISVSLASIELRPDGRGTALTLTEHGVFLDGHDDAGSREHGTRWLMDKLGASLGENVTA